MTRGSRDADGCGRSADNRLRSRVGYKKAAGSVEPADNGIGRTAEPSDQMSVRRFFSRENIFSFSVFALIGLAA